MTVVVWDDSAGSFDVLRPVHCYHQVISRRLLGGRRTRLHQEMHTEDDREDEDEDEGNSGSLPLKKSRVDVFSISEPSPSSMDSSGFSPRVSSFEGSCCGSSSSESSNSPCSAMWTPTSLSPGPGLDMDLEEGLGFGPLPNSLDEAFSLAPSPMSPTLWGDEIDSMYLSCFEDYMRL